MPTELEAGRRPYECYMRLKRALPSLTLARLGGLFLASNLAADSEQTDESLGSITKVT